MNKYEIAKLIEFNGKAENQAVFDYTDLINELVKSEDLTDEEKNVLIDAITELIQDELNHQEKLIECYTYLTKIEPAID